MTSDDDRPRSSGRHAQPDDSGERQPRGEADPGSVTPPVHSDIWIPPNEPLTGEIPRVTTGPDYPATSGPDYPATSGPDYLATSGPDYPAPTDSDYPGAVDREYAAAGVADGPLSGPGAGAPVPEARGGAPTAALAAAAPGGMAVQDKAAPRVKSTDRKRSQRKLAYWLVAPAALVMALVAGYPIIYAFWLSLNHASLRDDETSFAGLSNYTTVLSSNYWWTSLWVTLVITVISVIVELVLGMAIALVMHRAMFGKGLVRTVVLIPYGIVTVAAAVSWKYAWTPGTGYLANLLPDGSAPLTEQIPSIAIVILAEIWKTTPFMALLLLAGLALVPDDLLKAAQMDGAGAWTRLRRVILPMMKPAILVALLFRALDAFRIFDNIYVLTAGNNKTGSVSMLGYDNLFKAFNLGIGSAISVLIFLCVAVIAVIFIKGFGTAAPGSDDEGR